MCSYSNNLAIGQEVHPWLSKVHVAYVKGPTVTPLGGEVIEKVLNAFKNLGHTIQDKPTNDTDIILTTAAYGEPISWRKTLALIARMKYRLDHLPTVFTLVHATPEQFDEMLDYFDKVLQKEEPDPADYKFPGLADDAYDVLHKHGRRGGPIMAASRVIQAQAKCLHVLLLIGDDTPQRVYHFDLVGGYPQSKADDLNSMYVNIALRMVTTVSTREITNHQVVAELVPYSLWQTLDTPNAMRIAAQELGKRHFFTDMVRINDIVKVPAVQEAIHSQYSEGCFATWDPKLGGLISTVTGSARPVDKDNITENDLAVIVGVRADGEGAVVRHVENKVNDPPSSEAVELILMDESLPQIELNESEWGISATVPVARSKLHGHRGVSAFNPELVEYVPLDAAYYNYPVTCATEAQARGIHSAFSRSEALLNPDDTRQVVFTVLPTHG
ncbi:MAG: hypothetical protein PVF74_09090, partial [Anaerolineales bacterium]